MVNNLIDFHELDSKREFTFLYLILLILFDCKLANMSAKTAKLFKCVTYCHARIVLKHIDEVK